MWTSGDATGVGDLEEATLLRGGIVDAGVSVVSPGRALCARLAPLVPSIVDAGGRVAIRIRICTWMWRSSILFRGNTIRHNHNAFRTFGEM